MLKVQHLTMQVNMVYTYVCMYIDIYVPTIQ